MLRSIVLGLIITAILLTMSCGKDNPTITPTSGPNLIFKFKFDSTQARLDGFGNPSTMTMGHSGQNPQFNVMGAHYIELDSLSTTIFGTGAILYNAATIGAGSPPPIDFSKEVQSKEGETFFSIPLKNVTPGVFQYLRISLAYQNYDVKYRIDTAYPVAHGLIPGDTFPVHQDFPCTVASFIGYNTYITNFLIKTQTIPVNASKPQGFWGYETQVNLGAYYNQTLTQTGQAAGTTVVNPLHFSSPIPLNSCVVTGQFLRSGQTTPSNLTITGNETQDVVVTVSLSTNKSFEYTDPNHNGKWEPLKGEVVTDMGIRGMIPIVQ